MHNTINTKSHPEYVAHSLVMLPSLTHISLSRLQAGSRHVRSPRPRQHDRAAILLEHVQHWWKDINMHRYAEGTPTQAALNASRGTFEQVLD